MNNGSVFGSVAYELGIWYLDLASSWDDSYSSTSRGGIVKERTIPSFEVTSIELDDGSRLALISSEHSVLNIDFSTIIEFY